MKEKHMYKWCKDKPCKELLEIIQVARDLRDMTVRLAEERDAVQKDLSITKLQLEAANEQIV